MEDSLLSQGLSLMVYGMGVVFLFLTALVIVTTAMSTVIEKYFPDRSPLQTTPPASSTNPTARPPVPAIEPGLVRAIEAAIAQHRDRRRR